MCECFGHADVEIEERPSRYYGGSSTRRISFVRDIDRGDYEGTYSRPRSSTTSMRQLGSRQSSFGPRGSVRQLAYRPAREYRRDRSEDRGRDWQRTQYQSPSKIIYPGGNNASRFVPLPPKIRDRERDEMREEIIQEPRKGILRNGKKKYSSQRSMVVYSPKRGRKDRKYYYEDEDSETESESDRNSWDERSERSELTDMTEASEDSWAMRPVRKYSTTKAKRYTTGRSRSRGRGGEGRWD